jgi:glycosyltransferase involved in cell wall biosynthesis
MVYTPENSSDRGLSWLLSISSVHLKTPYKAFSKWLWRNRSGIFTDFHRHGVKVFHGLDSVLPSGHGKEKVRMVTTVRDLTFKRFMNDYTWFEKLRRSSRIGHACKRADRIIATSEYIKDSIIKKYGTSANKIDVIYTAYRDEYIENLKDPIFIQNTKGKYNLPSNFILAVTDFGDLSNMETLYKAFAKIDDKKIDLVIIGKKNDRYRQLKRLAEKLNIEERIVRVSSVNKHNFMCLYALLKAFIDPSIADGMGQCVIEAMISGTPLITSDDGCHREIAKDVALYFNPKNEEQLAKHINTVLSSPDRCKALTDKGKELAAAFTQHNLAQSTMLTYDRARGKA